MKLLYFQWAQPIFAYFLCKVTNKMGKIGVWGRKMYGWCKFFSPLVFHGDCLTQCLCFIVINKERRYTLCISFELLSRSVFASYLQALVQESAFSQVAQVSATQVSALQQESTATQHVSAFSHVVSLHFLFQHELMMRAATATITNNTFFISLLN